MQQLSLRVWEAACGILHCRHDNGITLVSVVVLKITWNNFNTYIIQNRVSNNLLRKRDAIENERHNVYIYTASSVLVVAVCRTRTCLGVPY